MTFKRLSVLVLAVLLAATLAGCGVKVYDGTATISGRITDARGELITDPVKVRFSGSQEVTSVNGIYEISDVKAGTLSLTATPLSGEAATVYGAYNGKVKIDKGVHELDITLNRKGAVYEAYFEAPAFTSGETLNGQKGVVNYVFSGTTAKIQNQFKNTGSQALELKGGMLNIYHTTKNGAKFQVEFYVYMPGTDNHLNMYIGNAYWNIAYQAEIQYPSGNLNCLNGNGAGSGTWATGGITVNKQQFTKLTFQINTSAKTWKVKMDDGAWSSDFGFRHGAVPGVGWLSFQNTRTEPVYIDDIIVQEIQ